jgi:BMFP domain-containing protein YqiC
MKKDNHFLDDLSKMASSAVSTMMTIKQDLATYIKQQIKLGLKNMDFVSKNDFKALKKSVEILQAEIAQLKGAHKKDGTQPKPAKKPAVKAKKMPL